MADALPPPPVRPPEDECCHRHCEPCVFDYYEAALERWRKAAAERGLDPDELLASQTAP